MATGRVFRRCILGLSCSVLPLMGCAQGPAPQAKGLFGWFRSAPLSDAEKQQKEQEKATQKLKDPTSLHIKYAEWREQVGDLTDARKSYQFALQENPKALEAKLGLARLDQLSGRTADAEKEFQEILQSHPGDARALEALGQFYASQKTWAKALPLLEDAADAAPGELSYRHHFAVALGQSGNMDAALAQFRQAVGDAEAHYNVAYLLYDKGHKDLARGQLRQALVLNPQFHQAQALLDELEETTGRAVVATATHPHEYPPVQRVQHASAEFAQRPLTQTSFSQQGNSYPPQTPRTQAAPRQQPMPQTPVQRQPQQIPAWTPARAGTPISQPGPAVHNRSAGQQQAPAAVPQTTIPAPQPKPEPAPAPMWRKHQPEESAARQTNYLPPDSPASNTGTPTKTPGISAAQREQWENQMKAAAQ